MRLCERGTFVWSLSPERTSVKKDAIYCDSVVHPFPACAFCGIGACVFLKYRPPTLNATTLIVSTERHRFTTRARKFGPYHKPRVNQEGYPNLELKLTKQPSSNSA